MYSLKITLNTALLLTMLTATNAIAQPAGSSIDLDINQIRARQMLNGDMWYNTSIDRPAVECPKGSNKHASAASGIWMGGFDRSSGILKGAATLYGSEGVDFHPGPLDATGTCDPASAEEWNRFWKIDAAQIKTFLALSPKTTATIPDVILEWPAKGNIYATGSTGTKLNITTDMAPFVDVDKDGIYNPLAGDYPQMKGDQMIWSVMNDNTKIHAVSRAQPMQVEIHATSYAYDRSSAVGRMAFYEYEVYNKSKSPLDSFVFALWSDIDLGNPFDDALAIDATHRMVVAFNPAGDGPYGANSYGNNSPLSATAFLEMPGDNYPSAMQKTTSFTYFEGMASGKYRAPKAMPEFYNYMTGRNADGDPMEYGTGRNRYFYDMNASWNPCDTLNVVMDRRYIMATTPSNSFNPGTSKKIAFALMVTDTTPHICPDLGFKDITDMANTALEVYYNPSLGNKEYPTPKSVLNVYPNPAQSILYVGVAQISGKETIRVVDALGKTIVLPVVRNSSQFEISIHALAPGIYSVQYDNGEQLSSQTFVKK